MNETTRKDTTCSDKQSGKQPGLWGRIFGRLDKAMKEKAEASAKQGSCCCPENKDKGGTCC